MTRRNRHDQSARQAIPLRDRSIFGSSRCTSCSGLDRNRPSAPLSSLGRRALHDASCARMPKTTCPFLEGTTRREAFFCLDASRRSMPAFRLAIGSGVCRPRGCPPCPSWGDLAPMSVRSLRPHTETEHRRHRGAVPRLRLRVRERNTTSSRRFMRAVCAATRIRLRLVIPYTSGRR